MKLNEVEKKSVTLLYLIWNSIDFKSMKSHRLMKIWGEFEDKVKFASYRPTGSQFLEQIRKKMGIETIRDTSVIEILDDPEILKNIRENTTKTVLILKSLTDIKKKKVKELEKLSNEEKKKSGFTISTLFDEFESENIVVAKIDIEKEWEDFING